MKQPKNYIPAPHSTLHIDQRLRIPHLKIKYSVSEDKCCIFTKRFAKRCSGGVSHLNSVNGSLDMNNYRCACPSPCHDCTMTKIKDFCSRNPCNTSSLTDFGVWNSFLMVFGTFGRSYSIFENREMHDQLIII